VQIRGFSDGPLKFVFFIQGIGVSRGYLIIKEGGGMGKTVKLLIAIAVIVIAALIAYSMILAPILHRGWTE
jgi:hypothetical protein